MWPYPWLLNFHTRMFKGGAGKLHILELTSRDFNSVDQGKAKASEILTSNPK